MREKGDRDAAVSREGAAAQLSSGRTAHAGGEAGAARRARVLVQELRERAQGPDVGRGITCAKSGVIQRVSTAHFAR
jgi:hypothetical protein